MAQVTWERCVGCGKCARECPASVISIRWCRDKKQWYDYLWIVSLTYLVMDLITMVLFKSRSAVQWGL